MNLRELLARRDAIRVELRAILEKHPDGLPDDAQQRADELQTEAERLNDLEARLVALDDLDRRSGGRPLDGGGGQDQRREVRVFSDLPARVPDGFDGMIWRAADGSRVPILEQRHKLTSFLAPESPASELGLSGFLRSLRFGPKNELERRVLGEASIGAGGALVPTPLAAEVIDLLRPRTVALQAGARIIPMTTATLRFARETADPTGSWRAENANIAMSQPVFDNLTLTAQSWGVIVQASRELLEDAPNIDAALRNVFARSTAVALDQAILYGSGHTNNQPQGIAGTSGIQTVSMGTNGAQPLSYAPFLDAIQALESANAGDVSAAIMPPRTSRNFNGLTDSLAQPLRRPDRIVGMPFLITTSMPINETQGTATNASSIILGAFSEVFVGMRTELVITVLQELYAGSGQIGFVLWLRADVAISRPAAMARIEGITAS